MYKRRFIDSFNLSKEYDVAIVQAELMPFMPNWIEKKLLRIPYIYDMDDAFFLKYKVGKYRLFSSVLGAKFDSMMADAAVVTAGNDYLAAYARRFNEETIVLPTVVDLSRYYSRSLADGRCYTVGWIGSPSTSKYLSLIRESLAVLGREGPVKLLVVGGECDPIENVEVVTLPWSEESEIRLIYIPYLFEAH